MSKSKLSDVRLPDLKEDEKDGLWLINRWEEHNKMQLANLRHNIKILIIEEKLIRSIKKKWKS